MSNYKKVLSVKNQIEQQWLEKEGIQGVSIGESEDGGSFAIFIHVDSSRAISTHRIPSAFEDIQVIHVIEDLPTSQADTSKYRLNQMRCAVVDMFSLSKVLFKLILLTHHKIVLKISTGKSFAPSKIK